MIKHFALSRFFSRNTGWINDQTSATKAKYSMKIIDPVRAGKAI